MPEDTKPASIPEKIEPAALDPRHPDHPDQIERGAREQQAKDDKVAARTRKETGRGR